MRRYTILFLTMISSICSIAQEKLAIKEGSSLQYTVHVNGQTFPVYIQIDSLNSNSCSFTWSYEDGRSGRYLMEKSSLDTARLGYWNPPVVGEELILPPSKTILVISRNLFSTLQKK